MNEDQLKQVRAGRWKNAPPGAEAAYEDKCAAWEQMTDEEIWGGPRPPLSPIRRPEGAAP